MKSRHINWDGSNNFLRHHSSSFYYIYIYSNKTYLFNYSPLLMDLLPLSHQQENNKNNKVLLKFVKNYMCHVLFFLFLLFSSILFYNLLSPLHHDPLVIGIDHSFFSKNSSCDYSYGKWIWDEKYVLDQYNENCPFLDPGFRCRKSGRRDLDYRKWRWQPQHCHLPR